MTADSAIHLEINAQFFKALYIPSTLSGISDKKATYN